MNADITAEEIERAMRRLKNDKAPGPTTGIPNELVKYSHADLHGGRQVPDADPVAS
jgi:hypothetical protein